MLVDSIEAASRTVDRPDREQFEHMIQRIIFTKLKQGQLDDSGLDMGDLRTITNRMAETLVNMHHHRIKYQWQAQRAEEFGVPSRVVRDSAPNIEVHSMRTAPPPGASGAPPPGSAAPSGPSAAPAPGSSPTAAPRPPSTTSRPEPERPLIPTVPSPPDDELSGPRPAGLGKGSGNGRNRR